MNVLIAGGTGMVGKLILKECIESELITSITSIVRKASQSEPNYKVNEVVVKDFENYSDNKEIFKNINLAFFCIGVYTGQVSTEQFQKITVDYAVGFAKELNQNNPKATLCLLSGAGADRTEKSKTAFARFKGMAENQISDLNLNFYSFRPGYIYPVTPRNEPNLMYTISRLLYPIVKLMGDNFSIKSTELARSMFVVGTKGADDEILENKDILAQLKK